LVDLLPLLDHAVLGFLLDPDFLGPVLDFLIQLRLHFLLHLLLQYLISNTWLPRPSPVGVDGSGLSAAGH
jgi:hypothetical protein